MKVERRRRDLDMQILVAVCCWVHMGRVDWIVVRIAVGG